MAEQIVSPGVFTRENDQSFITQQPVEVGGALVGPTVLGPVEIPTIVTSYSQYQNKFGSTFVSGGRVYSHLTAISAYNYFQNGGNTLLVTRVVTGSFTPATASIANGTVVGNIDTTADALLGSINSNPTDAGAATYTGVSLTGGNGTGAVATVVVTGTTAPTITGITVTSPGSGYSIADNLAIAAGALGTGQLINAQDVLSISNGAAYALGTVTGPLTVAQSSTSLAGAGASFTITGDGTNVSALTVSSIGTGYVALEVITISAADLITAGFTGATGDLTITLGAGSANVANSTAGAIILVANDFASDPSSTNSFRLKTISEGTIMNSDGTLGSQGQLSNGTDDNVRWEISFADTGSGTFNLLIRQGNDLTNDKIVLETYAGISLDPFQDNYIAKVIGDSSQKLLSDSDGNKYLQVSGSYPNKSSYVYVDEVLTPTPNFFNNVGSPASEQFKESIPVVASGSFGTATGELTGSEQALFNELIDTNTQGLRAEDYSDAFSLLTNNDEYQYNVITAPGLIHGVSAHTGVLNTLIANTQNRGDAIAVVDLTKYGSTITSTTGQAASINSSYAASYWPWCQIINPNTGKTNWVPASTLIPGVYAFNDNASEPWFAPAGINRGGLSQVIRPERKLQRSQRDTLYEKNVNPIANFPNTGTVVFGQKTLQKKASALDRVNVRRLLIALKSYIGQVANNLVFEQNTIATRNNFLAQVNPYMESVQQRQGVYAFKVVMDASNNTPDVIDRNQMVGQIFLQPTRTAEFIILDFNVLPTGAEFPA
jgi:hypothetical protein